MSVKLGMFTMPFHHPDRDYASILAEDQEAVILADQLGFTEAYIGEHFSSWSERITSPLIFLASVIDRTKRIRLGTGVLSLPMMLESIDIVLKLWAQDPPYRIDGRFWKISLENAVWPEFKVGYVPRP